MQVAKERETEDAGPMLTGSPVDDPQFEEEATSMGSAGGEVPVMQRVTERGNTPNATTEAAPEHVLSPHSNGNENATPYIATSPECHDVHETRKSVHINQPTNNNLGPAPVEARRRDVKNVRGNRLRIASKKLPGKQKNSINAANGGDSLRTSREGSNAERCNSRLGSLSLGEKMNGWAIPAAVSLHPRRSSLSTERNEEPEAIPFHSLLTVEERLRLIREEQQQRMEKMYQKLVMERADTVAPRPKTLTRNAQGRLKAIAMGRSHFSTSSGTPLAIKFTSSSVSNTDSQKGRKMSLLGCDVVPSQSVQPVSPPYVTHEEQSKVEQLPLEIDREDQLSSPQDSPIYM